MALLQKLLHRAEWTYMLQCYTRVGRVHQTSEARHLANDVLNILLGYKAKTTDILFDDCLSFRGGEKVPVPIQFSPQVLLAPRMRRRKIEVPARSLVSSAEERKGREASRGEVYETRHDPASPARYVSQLVCSVICNVRTSHVQSPPPSGGLLYP